MLTSLGCYFEKTDLFLSGRRCFPKNQIYEQLQPGKNFLFSLAAVPLKTVKAVKAEKAGKAVKASKNSESNAQYVKKNIRMATIQYFVRKYGPIQCFMNTENKAPATRHKDTVQGEGSRQSNSRVDDFSFSLFSMLVHFSVYSRLTSKYVCPKKKTKEGR